MVGIPVLILYRKHIVVKRGGDLTKNQVVKSEGLKPVVLPALAGVMVALLITVAGAMICACAMNKGSMGQNGAAIASMGIWFISSIVATFLPGKMAKSNIVTAVVIAVVLYFVLLIGAKSLFFSAPFSAIGKGSAIIAAGSAPAIILALRGKVEKKPKFKYKP